MARTARWALGIIFLLIAAIGVARAETTSKRVALVIGNSAYRSVDRLANSANDAKLIARTLQALGFTIVGGGAQLDLDKSQFDAAVRLFGASIQDADVALFYYSGHGMQVAGENWLVPVDANNVTRRELNFQMVDAALVLQQMEGSGTKLNLVILDACRNNPFAGRGLRDMQAGLAEMHAPEGTLISYATQPGNVASDGVGADSPYTTALAEAIRQPGLDIFQVFNRVGLAVKQRTGGDQQPWLASSPISGSFYFAAAAAAAASTAPQTSSSDIDIVYWQSISASANPDDFRQYLRDYPTGHFAGLARNRLNQLALATPAPQMPGGTGTPSENDRRGKEAFDRKDYQTAMKWYRQAADQGDAVAQHYIGYLYEIGLGVPADLVEAMRWYRKAADQGFASAQSQIGYLYRHGLGVAADPVEAMKWYHKAADQGIAAAQSEIGDLYREGLGVSPNPVEAMTWYRKAADQGNAIAIGNIGYLYQNGLGVPADPVEAMRWYRNAADQGNTTAQSNIGYLYQNGLGVLADPVEAMKWYRKAADQGNAVAQYNIGHLYQNGFGVPTNLVEAVKWYRKAADQGEPDAKNALAALSQRSVHMVDKPK